MISIKKMATILLLGTMILTGASACTKTVTPAETTEIVGDELAAAKAEIDRIEQELVEAQLVTAELDAMVAKLEELEKRYDSKVSELDVAAAQYTKLKLDYVDLTQKSNTSTQNYATLENQFRELQRELDLIAQKAAEINEASIADALFSLINQARTSQGLAAITWNDNLRVLLETNGKNMAESKQYQYYSLVWVPFQEVFWATGYASVESLTGAAMTVWKSNSLRYSNNVLADDAKYGAVGVYNVDGIYYITFGASVYPYNL
ncbi:MAG: hypothetical protein A2Z29_02635 [Chloroflexi bacterium RBG_16_56_11]|nr:MAG: hypothetical protein A2Z29_02635 [Chloroflexi bacterium RBG_16_56_11]